MSLLKRIEQGQGSDSDPKSQGASKSGSSDSSRLSSLQTKRTNAPITSPQAGSYFDLKTRVQNKLLAELDPSMDITRTEEVKRTIQELFEQILSEEHIEDIDIFIAVTDDEEDNILLSLLAKQKGAKKTIALIHNMTYTQFVSNLGVDLVINPNLCAINRILHFIRKGKVLSVASFYEKNAEAIEAVALETSDLVHTPLKKLSFPKGAIIGAILRNGELIVPKGDSVIEPGDHVIIFALSNAIQRVEKILMVKLEYW